MKNTFRIVDLREDGLVMDYGHFETMKEAIEFKSSINLQDRDHAEIISQASYEEMIGVKYVVARIFGGKLCNVGESNGPTGAFVLMRNCWPTSGRVMKLEDWNKLPILDGEDPEQVRAI